MNTRLIAAVILGSFVLAGCGGGSSDTAQDEADMQVADAQQERIDELEEDLADAQEQARLAQAAREREQAEKERLEREAEEARQVANAAEAARVHTGLGTITHDLTVSPRYGAAADITNPAVTSSGAGSMRRWFKTTGSSRTQTAADRVEIYSDVEAPTPVPFKDSPLNLGNAVIDTEGEYVTDNAGIFAEMALGIAITDDRRDAASSSFPRPNIPPKQFDYVNRGFENQAAKDTEIANCSDEAACLARVRNIPVRNTERYPQQYSVDVRGSLQGASGTFRCSSATDGGDACTVQNRGGTPHFAGPWRFLPTSATVSVQVPDGQYMWFGWWSRETLPGGAFAFNTDHGGPGLLTALTNVMGTATYNGIAVGRYAISGTLVANQGHGDFTADAQLVANFGEDSVVGTLSGFTGQPDWEVSLGGGTIAGAAVTGAADSVTWSIGGDAKDGGQWEADFYSNLPANQREGIQPYGIAGTFEAEHGDAARMVGAFGAHR